MSYYHFLSNFQLHLSSLSGDYADLTYRYGSRHVIIDGI